MVTTTKILLLSKEEYHGRHDRGEVVELESSSYLLF
jgi:hypothetical protein